MLDKASRLEWASYALVRKAVADFDLSSALILAKYFQRKFSVLQKKERLKVQAEYGIDSNLIDNDVKYIQTRLRGSNTPEPATQISCAQN